jgi:group I intron endonuclease
MGSGKLIKQAIEKYGLDNFDKEILEFFDDESTMLLRESEVVDGVFLEDPNTYNLKVGGTGGFGYILDNGLHQTAETKKKRIEGIKKSYIGRVVSGENSTFFGKRHLDLTKAIISEKKREYFNRGGEHPRGMLGKTHKETTKERQRTATISNSKMRGKFGTAHPTGGKVWYNNGISHVRSSTHPGDGWVEGRIFKKRNRKDCEG